MFHIFYFSSVFIFLGFSCPFTVFLSVIWSPSLPLHRKKRLFYLFSWAKCTASPFLHVCTPNSFSLFSLELFPSLTWFPLIGFGKETPLHPTLAIQEAEFCLLQKRPASSCIHGQVSVSSLLVPHRKQGVESGSPLAAF